MGDVLSFVTLYARLREDSSRVKDRRVEVSVVVKMCGFLHSRELCVEARAIVGGAPLVARKRIGEVMPQGFTDDGTPLSQAPLEPGLATNDRAVAAVQALLRTLREHCSELGIAVVEIELAVPPAGEPRDADGVGPDIEFPRWPKKVGFDLGPDPGRHEEDLP